MILEIVVESRFTLFPFLCLSAWTQGSDNYLFFKQCHNYPSRLEDGCTCGKSRKKRKKIPFTQTQVGQMTG